MENVSVVIPVYNEEAAILETIHFFKLSVEKNPGIEVIIVNDGSDDGTLKILETHAGEKLRVINHDCNKGYGAALKSGIKQASKEYIAITDADGSYPNEKISELYAQLVLENGDMIVGARTGEVVEARTLRRLFKFFLRKLAEYLSGERIPDFNSGLRVLKKDLFQKINRYLPDGFSFTTTLTLSLLASAHKIIYVPVSYHKRKGKSKIRPFRDTLNFIQLIIRTVMFFNPLKIFLPLSCFFFFLAIVVLVLSYLLGRVWDITTILLFVTGLQILALGLLADLIDKRLPK